MIKLKIGDNYLITTNKDPNMDNFIIYMMGCFNNSNKVAIGIDLIHHIPSPSVQNIFDDYIKALKEEKITEVYMLLDIHKKFWKNYENIFRDFLKKVYEAIPVIKITVIRITRQKLSREYKIAQNLYDVLTLDKRNILHYLPKLDEYKKYSNRYKAIPGELKIINESIKKLSKEEKICEKKVTLKDLEYLNLIDNAELRGDDLILDIKPLPIYPSEPLGKVFTLDSFKNNKYLAQAAKYLYQGCHFGMVGTTICIHPNFTPEFIETRDHTWDDMMRRNNWSSIGYLHFGQGHLCGGEFNDVIAHTKEHGLEYYFNCLKQYITTANMRDYAGKKVWWYPIYNDKHELVYCAALDILRDELLDLGISREEKQKVENMSWDDFLIWKQNHNVSFKNIDTHYTSDRPGCHSMKQDMFLEYCKQHRPEWLEEIEKGAN